MYSVYMQSEEYGSEWFGDHDELQPALEQIQRLAESASRYGKDDKVVREVQLEIKPC